jgi:ATP-dependent transcriptional regulator
MNKEVNILIVEDDLIIAENIYSGKNNQQIAKENYVSINTVKTHIRNLYDKLEVHSRSELLAKVRLMMDQN